MSYISVTELRKYTNLSADVMSDGELQDHIQAAEEFINIYCGTKFTSESVTEVIDGNDSDLIIPNHQPIINVSNIYYSFDYGTTWNLLNNTDYVVKDYGVVLKPTSIMARQTKNVSQIKMVFTYGHATVPKLIKEAMYDISGMYALGFVYDRNVTSDSLKLGDATIYKSDYAKKKEGILNIAYEKLNKYKYDELILVR